MKRLLFIPLPLIFLLLSCNNVNAPKRAKGVPLNATWIGGSDGEKWFLIEKVDREAKTAHFQIYNDYTGDLDINKSFTLQCDNENEIKWDDLLSQVTGYDGTLIFLSIINRDKKYCYFK